MGQQGSASSDLPMLHDGSRCHACRTTAVQALARHHIIPVHLGGDNSPGNFTTLCANCHRLVHWLSSRDRALDPGAHGLGASAGERERLLVLARRIRDRRLEVVGPGLQLTTSVSLSVAIDQVVARNGLERAEAKLLARCVRRALAAMHPEDRRQCAVRLVRDARFLSVNANNHLAIRVPGHPDRGSRADGSDILLIWPQAVRPSILSPAEFRRASEGRFKLIPHFNWSLTWDECLALSRSDWDVFADACHDALTLVRTRRWTSNVLLS